MPDFFQDWGALIVAVVALTYPAAIWAWSRFFRRGITDIYETGTIEIGFSSSGATIGLQGTLRAIHQDQFVSRISLALTRLHDQSQHPFSWGVFRAHKVVIGAAAQELEVPSGFMLTTASPRRYNIQFFDLDSQTSVGTHSATIWEAWNQTVLDSGVLDTREQSQTYTVVSGQSEYDAKMDSLYDDIAKTQVYVNAFADLGRVMYWEPGRYSVEMTVETARPNMKFSGKWNFELTEDGCRRLRLNGVLIAAAACGRGAGQFHFEYPIYEAVPEGQ